MDLKLKKKIVLVVGASKGLGAAAARRFAEEGACVAISARNEREVEATASAISSETDAELFPIAGDVTEPGHADRMVEETVARWGRLDILVTNSGGPTSGNFMDVGKEQWDNAVRLNLLSVVNLCRAALPHMLKNSLPERGSIVSITSFAVKQPLEKLVLSNSIRMAVIGLLKSIANEFGPQGIRVNAIAPGWTLTDRVTELMKFRANANGTSAEDEIRKQVAVIPLGRMAEPAEFADALVWLASPRASYVHGITLPVDGGAIKASL